MEYGTWNNRARSLGLKSRTLVVLKIIKLLEESAAFVSEETLFGY